MKILNSLQHSFDLNESTGIALEKATSYTLNRLKTFANDPEFSNKMGLAFGNQLNFDSIKSALLTEDYGILPAIEIYSSAELNGANGAYGVDTNKIYLAAEFLDKYQENIEVISTLLLEEIGHSFDNLLNPTDTPGDEGEYFAALVNNLTLSTAELARIKAEDDIATVNLNGRSIAIEQQVITGDSGNNNLVGTDGNDTLNGGSGDDNLHPGDGVDSIIGGTGQDRLNIDMSSDSEDITVNYTDPDNGKIIGGSKDGTSFREIETIWLKTGSGQDQVDVSTLNSGYWSADIYSGEGNDSVISGSASDRLYGEDGNDTLAGGQEFDRIYGGTGNDSVLGQAGNDELYGDDGKDTIDGGSGDDRLYPGHGVDSIIGGTGQAQDNNALVTAHETNIHQQRVFTVHFLKFLLFWKSIFIKFPFEESRLNIC